MENKSKNDGNQIIILADKVNFSFGFGLILAYMYIVYIYEIFQLTFLSKILVYATQLRCVWSSNL